MRLRKALVAIALLASIPVELEIILTLADPWGMRYFDDLASLSAAYTDDPVRGYRLPAGHYQLSRWSATQTNEGRLLPDNGTGPCHVVFVGDSVTWGYGVNDADTWVNRVAAQLNLSAVNAALTSYNSVNVRGTIGQYPDADALVYLIIRNDIEPTLGYGAPMKQQPPMRMIEKYGRFLLMAASNHVSPMDEMPADEIARLRQRFEADLQAIHTDPRVILMTFEGEIDPPDVPVAILPRYEGRISLSDAHPNALAHRDIAANVSALLKERLTCDH